MASHCRFWMEDAEQVGLPRRRSRDAPCIPLADESCLSGAWSFAVAKELPPDTQFTLLDFNPMLCRFSHPELPSNMSLLQFDLLQDFKDHPGFANRFDFVQQRLMVMAFTPAQYLEVFKEYLRALKPGGHIQVTEIITSPEYWKAGKWSSFGEGWMNRLASASGKDWHGTALKLGEHLKQAGFENISTHTAYLQVTDSFPHAPVENPLAVWAQAACSIAVAKANQLGLVDDATLGECRAGVWREWTTELQDDYSFGFITCVAQVRLFLGSGRDDVGDDG